MGNLLSKIEDGCDLDCWAEYGGELIRKFQYKNGENILERRNVVELFYESIDDLITGADSSYESLEKKIKQYKNVENFGGKYLNEGL